MDKFFSSYLKQEHVYPWGEDKFWRQIIIIFTGQLDVSIIMSFN